MLAHRKVLFAFLLAAVVFAIVWGFTRPRLIIENRSGKLIREFRLEVDDFLVISTDIEPNSTVKKRSKPDYTKSVSYFVKFEGGDVVTGKSGTTSIPHTGRAIVSVEEDGTIRTTLK